MRARNARATAARSGDAVLPTTKVSRTDASRSDSAAGLSASAELCLYTLDGRLVKTIRQADFGVSDMTWDLKNTVNVGVSKGIYIYTVTNAGGGRRTGRIVVR